MIGALFARYGNSSSERLCRRPGQGASDRWLSPGARDINNRSVCTVRKLHVFNRQIEHWPVAKFAHCGPPSAPCQEKSAGMRHRSGKSPMIRLVMFAALATIASSAPSFAQIAASIGGLLITTEAMVAEMPKKQGGCPYRKPHPASE
jgi:hypothetical protein